LKKGYNTKDVLDSLAFKMIISLTLKNLDITNPKEIAKWILKS
jgi:branched-subunit amino acid permease